MYSRCWLIIRDDSKRTFEICGQTDNGNSFTNNIHAMQKSGMNVSGTTPNITNKNASKDSIKVIGYTVEEGLYKRLQDQFRGITLGHVEDW